MANKANGTLTTTAPATAPATPTLQQIISSLQTAAANSTPATLHNVLTQAQAYAKAMPNTPAKNAAVIALGGYNVGGWRKTALQHIAAAFGLVPFVGTHSKPISPNTPKVVGQQAYFYGNANVATIAAAAYSAIFTAANKAGNAALRTARTSAKTANTKAANGRLQENVYNIVMETVLASLASVTPTAPAAALQAAFKQAYPAATVAKGGMVLNGAYNLQAYNPLNNGLAMVKIN